MFGGYNLKSLFIHQYAYNIKAWCFGDVVLFHVRFTSHHHSKFLIFIHILCRINLTEGGGARFHFYKDDLIAV